MKLTLQSSAVITAFDHSVICLPDAFQYCGKIYAVVITYAVLLKSRESEFGPDSSMLLLVDNFFSPLVSIVLAFDALFSVGSFELPLLDAMFNGELIQTVELSGKPADSHERICNADHSADRHFERATCKLSAFL